MHILLAVTSNWQLHNAIPINLGQKQRRKYFLGTPFFSENRSILLAGVMDFYCITEETMGSCRKTWQSGLMLGFWWIITQLYSWLLV